MTENTTVTCTSLFFLPGKLKIRYEFQLNSDATNDHVTEIATKEFLKDVSVLINFKESKAHVKIRHKETELTELELDTTTIANEVDRVIQEMLNNATIMHNFGSDPFEK